MAHPVTWFQIQGRDATGLHDFYVKAFGWKSRPSPDGSGLFFVDAEDGGIAGGIGPLGDDSDQNVAVYIDVDDIDEALLKIEAAGGKSSTYFPIARGDGQGTYAVFIDPAGNSIGLWQRGTPPPPVQALTVKATAKKKPAARKPAAKKAAAKKPAAKKAVVKKPAAKKAAAKKPAPKKAAPRGRSK